MGKKALTIDLTTGNKKLETIIDDVVAVGNQEVTYSGKFVDENLLSVSHDSHLVGEKLLDETNVSDKYVVSYNAQVDKLEYSSIENLVEVIDCGYF